MTLRDIFDEIVRERIKQDEEWGGPKHDDTHSLSHWCKHIQKQLNKTLLADKAGEREAFVKVAALACAAIESLDRRSNPIQEKSK